MTKYIQCVHTKVYFFCYKFKFKKKKKNVMSFIHKTRKFAFLSDIINEPVYLQQKETIKMHSLIFSINEENIEERKKQIFSYLETRPTYVNLIINTVSYSIHIRPIQKNSIIKMMLYLFEKYPEETRITISSKFSRKLGFFYHYFLFTDRLKADDFGIENLRLINLPNNDEQLSLLLHYYKKDSLPYFIKEDDISALQNLVLTSANFDFNTKIQTDFFFHPSFPDIISIIDFAALYGDVKCFKYLILNDAKITDLTNSAAIAGGNSEIIYALEQKDISFGTFCLRVSVEYSRNDLFDWLLLHYVEEIQGITLSFCVCCLNPEVFVFLYLNGYFQECIKNHKVGSILHSTGMTCNMPLIELLVEHGFVGKNCYEPRQITPIHYLCEDGYISIVRYLIERDGFDKEARDGSGQTPLFYACINNNLPTVKFLIEEQKVDPYVKDDIGRSPVHIAALNGHVPILQYFFDVVGLDKELMDENSTTCLSYACQTERIETVDYLITVAKVNKESRDNRNFTPLHFACFHNQLPVVKYLIEKANVDKSACAYFEMNALHIACDGGSVDLVKYLIEDVDFDKNAKDSNGKTPLHHACHSDNRSVVIYLIKEAKVDMNAKDIFGNSVLHFACISGHSTLIQYLIDVASIDKEITNSMKRTPLHISCQYGHLNDVQYLIEIMNVNKEAKDDDGKTPLHLACQFGQLPVVMYLIKSANVNKESVDNEGRRPIHDACQFGHVSIVNFLIENAHVEPSFPDYNGNSPLDLCKQDCSPETYSSILKIFR